MNKFKYLIFPLMFILLLFATGFKSDYKHTKQVYNVYLNGKVIGTISSKEKLLDLIDKEQSYLKKEYEVDKIYPPNGLKIKKVVTYNPTIDKIEDIYDRIKNEEPFTLKGYKVTIKTKDATQSVNVLKVNDFERAINNTVKAFVPEASYKKYLAGTQEEIVTEGTMIDNVEIKEDITIKEAYISSEDKIFTESDELTRYLLFGTLEKQKSYIVKAGDEVEKVALAHNLSTEELLIANPEIKSEKVLLYVGQEVNIGLIDPVISVIETSRTTKDQVVRYRTDEIKDAKMLVGKNKVEQEGSNGLSRITTTRETINGEIHRVVVTNTEEIIQSVNKRVRVGTKVPMNENWSGAPIILSGDWGWPVVSSCIITSHYGWRWGRLHDGTDMAGCGHGSPIYAAQAGVVIKAKMHNGSMGNNVNIDHHNGYITAYLHLSKIKVKEGQVVSKGQVIGAMGNTGRSTGTHLHFSVYRGGKPHAGGQSFNAMTLYK